MQHCAGASACEGYSCSLVVDDVIYSIIVPIVRGVILKI